MVACRERDHAILMSTMRRYRRDPRLQLEARDGSGATALMHCVDAGNVKGAAVLLRHKAAVGACDRHDRDALMRAASKGRHELVQMLVAAGAVQLHGLSFSLF